MKKTFTHKKSWHFTDSISNELLSYIRYYVHKFHFEREKRYYADIHRDNPVEIDDELTEMAVSRWAHDQMWKYVSEVEQRVRNFNNSYYEVPNPNEVKLLCANVANKEDFKDALRIVEKNIKDRVGDAPALRDMEELAAHFTENPYYQEYIRIRKAIGYEGKFPLE